MHEFTEDQLKEFRKTEEYFKNVYNLSIHPTTRFGARVVCLYDEPLKEEIAANKERIKVLSDVLLQLKKQYSKLSPIIKQRNENKTFWITGDVVRHIRQLYGQIDEDMTKALNAIELAIDAEQNSANRRDSHANEDRAAFEFFRLLSALLIKDNKVAWIDAIQLINYYLQREAVCYRWLERYSHKDKKFISTDEYDRLISTLKSKKVDLTMEEVEGIKMFFCGFHEYSNEFIDPELSHLHVR